MCGDNDYGLVFISVVIIDIETLFYIPAGHMYICLLWKKCPIRAFMHFKVGLLALVSFGTGLSSFLVYFARLVITYLSDLCL